MIQKEYPYRLWKLGFDFKRYAEVIFKNKINCAGSRPFYFMIGHSYELILKSFLLTKGIELKTLKKNKYGHNLLNLFKLAMKYKKFQEILGIKEIESNVDLLNTYYKDKDHEYIGAEIMFVKHPIVLFEDFDILSDVCEKTCEAFIL
jgi:hypothetical protein